MSVAEVIRRLANYGIWADVTGLVRARLEGIAARVKLPIADVAKTMARDAERFGAAIRCQAGVQVLWYARELKEILDACTAASSDLLLRDVLTLRESDA